MTAAEPAAGTAAGPIVRIRYCTGCRWLLRAQWYQGELLQTFADELGGVMLIPSSGAMFRIAVDGTTVWNRKTDGGFPDIADLKRRVRDLVAPGLSLGHTEGGGPSDDDTAPAGHRPDHTAPTGHRPDHTAPAGQRQDRQQGAGSPPSGPAGPPDR